jgi:deoxyribonuclease-1
MKIISILILFSLFPLSTFAANETNQSFSKAKKLLETKVYQSNRITLYCGASFDSKKSITPPIGFHTDKHVKRSKRVEWEHVVPAENFGRTFVEWRTGDKQCVSSKGKTYKGRRCANKVNAEYKYMQADMHNLFPAIGAVNAMRSNYNFQMLPHVQSGFGSCAMKIENRKAEPPIEARGRIARAYLYMDDTYSRYSMSNAQKQLMSAWDKMYPVSTWECKREENIANIQKNHNMFVERSCE